MRYCVCASAGADAAVRSQGVGATASDLVPANFLHDGQRLWVVDFEYCHVGHHEYDLANIASMNEFTPEESLHFATAYFAKRSELSRGTAGSRLHVDDNFEARQGIIKVRVLVLRRIAFARCD